MSRFGCSSMNEDSDKLEDVFGLVFAKIAQMIDGVGPHVDLVGECKIVVDLAPLHRPEVEVEALQVEDEIVRYVFETGPGSGG